jgi:hypothetical protein
VIVKQIIYFSTPCTLACDANCGKAWGVNNRPQIALDPNDEDDIAYLADGELDDAPADPGTYEGGQGKPQTPDQRLNKWCARECERSIMVNAKEGVKALPDYSKRFYNQPWKHT